MVRAYFGIIILGLSAFSLHSEENAPVILQVPLTLQADEDDIKTKVQISFPIVKIDKDIDSFIAQANGLQDAPASDVSLAAYLKALETGNNAEARKYRAAEMKTDDGRSKLQPLPEISQFERDCFLPKKEAVQIQGKTLLHNGTAYLFSRTDETGLDIFFISVLSTNGEQPKVQVMNSWQFLDVLGSSIPPHSLEKLWQNAPRGVSGEIFSKETVDTLFLSRANPAALAPILEAIDFFEKNAGKDSFTGPTPLSAQENPPSDSQDDFDREYNRLDSAKKIAHIKTFAANARQIAYVLDFDPLYISIQKKEAADTEAFYYLRGKDGRLRITNYNTEGPLDGVLRMLPEPSPELLSKFAIP